MNILFFYRVYPNYGGVEVVTTVLANRFIKDGHGVIIASIEQPHIELACQLLPDVKLVKLDYPVCSIKNMRKLHRLIYNPQIQISAESETKRSIFRKRDKTKRSKKESAQHSKSRNKSFVMTSVSAL